MESNHRLPLVALLCATLLSACAPQPSVRPVPEAGPDLASQAESARQRGDLGGAAELFERAAATATSPERERLLLTAAELRYGQGEIIQAQTLLSQVPAALPAPLAFRRRLLETRLLLATGYPDQAAERLQALGAPPQELRQVWLRTRAEVLAAAGQWLAAAQSRAELDGLLDNPEARLSNRQALWSLLSEVPMEVLRAYMPPPPDDFGGWLELAFLVRSYRLDLGQLTAAVRQWNDRYPGHPAAETVVPELLTRYQETLRAPERLALLLPVSGPLAGPARAILDGFMAAYYAAEGDRPSVQVYDVGSDGRYAVAAYQEAINAGADFVVGPLTKESLLQLTATSSLQVPVLALNTLPEGQTPPSGLFQFGLAPEDEAVAAADYAASRGHRRALVLVPEGDWGLRVAEAFAEAFSASGGEVLEVAAYDARSADFSDPIQAALNLDASGRRARQLRSVLRLSMEFEPRRREDVDVIFVGAYPREARLIRPQLKFFHAIDVPVIATSHAYGGKTDNADQDLDGVSFVDMPWILRPNPDEPASRARLAEQRPAAAQLPRLYALGIDAYRLIPYLETMRRFPGESVDGVSGVLSLDPQGRVHRQLFAGSFVNGAASTRGQPERAFGAPLAETAPPTDASALR